MSHPSRSIGCFNFFSRPDTSIHNRASGSFNIVKLVTSVFKAIDDALPDAKRQSTKEQAGCETAEYVGQRSQGDKDVAVRVKAILLQKLAAVSQELGELILYIEEEKGTTSLKGKKAKEDLIETSRNKEQVYGKKEEAENRLRSDEDKLKTLQSRYVNYQEMIERLENKFADLKRKIEEEKTKRSDAVVDSIPVIGIFSAVIGGIASGRHERMIPLYSMVTGLYSVIKDTKEDLEEELEDVQQQQDSVKYHLADLKNDISSQESSIRLFKSYLEDYQKQIDQLEKMVQALGRKVSLLTDWTDRLNTLQDKGSFYFRRIQRSLSLPREKVDEKDVKRYLIQVDRIKKEVFDGLLESVT